MKLTDNILTGRGTGGLQTGLRNLVLCLYGMIGLLAWNLWSVTAEAQVITLSADQTSAQSWSTGATWSDGLTPDNTKNYSNNGYLLRTPTSGSVTFPGATLTIEKTVVNMTTGLGNNGVLSLKTNNVTITDLTLKNGVVVNAFTGAATLNVTNLHINVASTAAAPSGISANSAVNTNINIGTLDGGGYLGLGIGGNATGNGQLKNLSITNGSAFTGTMDLWGGSLVLTSNIDLSNGVFTMKTGTVLTLGSLSAFNLTVDSFTYNGITLTPSDQAYNANDLNAFFGTTTQFSGLGSVTVIPEPETYVLLLGGVVFLFIMRRLHRRNGGTV